MDKPDLNERKKVWLALSDLFLDTDITLFYESIATVCAESPYSLSELKAILETEVASVCGGNLSCIAGEWAGLDEAWLINSILERTYNKGTSAIGVLARLTVKGYLKEHWDVLAKLIDGKRGFIDT